MTEAAQQDTRDFYNRISTSYDAIADSSEHAAREKGLEALAVQSGEHVLEIGFGTGHSLVQLAQAVESSGSVTGIDVSEGMKEVAEKRVQEAGVADRVKLVIDDAKKLPFQDDQFDVVTMSFTLELFELDVIPSVLAEIRRVLRPTGRVGIVSMATTPEGQDESTLTKIYKWLHRHFPHFIDCQPIDAAKFVEDAGFEITHRTDLKIWSLPVIVLVGKQKAS